MNMLISLIEKSSVFAQFGHPLSVLPLAQDASGRRYFRLVFNQSSFIACYYNENIQSFNDFFEVQDLFKGMGIRVPQIFSTLEDFPLMILSDHGDTHLGDLVKNPKSDVQLSLAYNRALDIILKVQAIPRSNGVLFQRALDKAKFAAEGKLSQVHFLDYYSDIFPGISQFASVYQQILELIHPLPMLPCHRDYHCYNIMIDQNELALIDFQDARLGPYTYDLASLLEDPYASIPSDLKDSLKQNFYCHISDSTSIAHSQFERDYSLVAVQRLYKALGTYWSQFNLFQKDKYLPFVEVCLARLLSELKFLFCICPPLAANPSALISSLSDLLGEIQQKGARLK